MATFACERNLLSGHQVVLVDRTPAIRTPATTAARLARAAAVNLVVAWRIFLMTLLGRDQPELAPEVMFCELEIQVLRAFAAEHRIRSPDTLAAAILVLARIGGHIHRPRGPPPGTKVMWRGTATLAGMCIGYRLAMAHQH